jgi:tetratricopeptide (TPR) repeat protein
MTNPPDDDLLGMTGYIMRRLEAQKNLKKNQGTNQDPPTKSKEVSSPVSYLKSSREINSHHRLALLYHTKDKLDDAERLYLEVLAALAQARVARPLETAQCLNNLARLYYEQKRYEEAEPLYHRSLKITEEIYGEAHPKAARRVSNLAELYCATGRIAEAAELYQRVLSIEEDELGRAHRSTKKTAQAYAALLRTLLQLDKADAVESHFDVRRVICERRSGFIRRIILRRVVERRTSTRQDVTQDRRQQTSRRAVISRRYSDAALVAI